MVSFEQFVYVVPMLALAASISYYAIVLRNQNRTRQAQLFMSFYDTLRSQEFRDQFGEILNQDYSDFDDFWEKYGQENNSEAWTKWQSVASFYHGMGILVKKGLVEPSLLDELVSPNVFMAWVVMGPVLIGFQERAEKGTLRSRWGDSDREGSLSKMYKPWSGFEYLNDMLKKREEKQLQSK